MNMWPQILMVLLLVASVIGGFFDHGNMSKFPTNRAAVLLSALWVALILGMGGFWTQR